MLGSFHDATIVLSADLCKALVSVAFMLTSDLGRVIIAFLGFPFYRTLSFVL